MAGNTDVTKQVLIANPTACCLAGDTRRIKHGKCDFTATAANLAYCVFTLAAGVFAIALRFWIGEAVMPTIAGDYLADFCSDGPYSGACFGMMATYRISLALTLFFVIHAVATLFVRSLHYTLWILKLPLAVVLFVGCFALPNEFYVVYYYFEAVGAFLFVSVVIVEFVDFTFGIQTWFAMKLLTWNGAAHIALSITYLGATVITNALWIAGIVTMYFFFSKCPLQLTFLITTTIINLALVVLSLLIEVLWCAWNPTGDDVEEEDRKWPCETKTSSGVMPAAVISLFNVTYTYMSLVSEPSEECNPFANAQQLAPVTLTLMYQALIICWMCFRTASALFSCCCGGCNGEEEEEEGWGGASAPEEPAGLQINTDRPTTIIGFGKQPKASSGGAVDPEDDESWIRMRPKVGFTSCSCCCGPQGMWIHPEPYFHAAMALGAMYLGMTLTNWGVANADSREGDLSLSYAAVWVKMAHVWLCSGIFLWVILAPVVCFRRDFTKELLC